MPLNLIAFFSMRWKALIGFSLFVCMQTLDGGPWEEWKILALAETGTNVSFEGSFPVCFQL